MAQLVGQGGSSFKVAPWPPSAVVVENRTHGALLGGPSFRTELPSKIPVPTAGGNSFSPYQCYETQKNVGVPYAGAPWPDSSWSMNTMTKMEREDLHETYARTPGIVSSVAYASQAPVGNVPYMSYASSQRKSAPPRYPQWLEGGESRQHRILVNLDELRLFNQPPDLLPAFYQTTSYFASFHPNSEQEQAISLPHDVPKPGHTHHGEHIHHGEHMTSKAVKAQRPMLQLQQYGSNATVAQFLEELTLDRNHMDLHICVYIWGVRATMFSQEEPVLVGRALLPMSDWSLQRKLVPWSVSDIPTGMRVGEMVLKYEVTSTPSAPRHPQVSDVARHEVTLHWTPPKSDHGSPIVGYRIDMLVQEKNDDPCWRCLCECSQLNPVYCVSGLEPHRPYTFEVCAINGVGIGDPLEFQVHTAACEPAAPVKPWLKKQRNGGMHVLVAWYAPGWDGGSPVEAYKLVMRVLPGASKYNMLWGPSEDDASWVDVAEIDVATHHHEHGPDVYSQWVELEEPNCEYRFKVYAVNVAGRSRGSELSNAHYVS